jgi:hypothetical protein
MLRAGTPIGLFFTLRFHPVLGRFFAFSQIGFASGYGEQQGQYDQECFQFFSFLKERDRGGLFGSGFGVLSLG